MQRIAFLLKVKQDRLAEYKQRHQEVWPEMLEALRETGWRNYSLFLRDDGLLYWDDCVEIFLDPSGRNSGRFVQLILTAGGGLFDAKDGQASWGCEGLRVARHIEEGHWFIEALTES